jgi:hypothetical protein
MPELPGPPEDYDDDQRQAWLEGAATVAGLLGQQGQIIAARYGDAGAETESEENDATEAGEDACPQCGAALVESLGGDVCLECDYEPD